MGEVRFWSDTHFNHQKILEYQPGRGVWMGIDGFPQTNVTYMNEWLIHLWNLRVRKDDHIWFGGDLAMGRRADAQDIFGRLNGHKHLVRGNHDNKVIEKLGWESVHDIVQVRSGDALFVICHYPFEVWDRAHHGAIHLHGHSHGNLKTFLPRRFDIGVDGIGWQGPVSPQQIIEMAKRPEHTYKPIDHHGTREE